MFWLQSNKHLFSSSVVKSQAWFFSTLTLHHELKDNEHQISCANVNKKRVGPGSLWDIGPARYPKDGFFIVLCSLECARNDNSHPEFITLINSVMNSGWELSFRAHSDEHGTMKNPSLRYLAGVSQDTFSSSLES